jgi:hypothetical protein
MMRAFKWFFLVLLISGLHGCTLPKAIETYDAKDCAEIRKLAQEQFLNRTPAETPRYNDSQGNDIADEILGVLIQNNDHIENQAKRTSYNRRCK